MDEHMVLDWGETLRLKSDIIEENRKGLTVWTDKHNQYSDRELRDILDQEQRPSPDSWQDLADQARHKRWAKSNIYLRLPLFLRAFLYWAFRYFLLLGFIDGRPGLVFHFLQGFWYRFLVDAKIYELRYKKGNQNTE